MDDLASRALTSTLTKRVAIVTLVLLFSLVIVFVLTRRASAVSLTITDLPNTIAQGNSVTFSLKVDFETFDRIPIQQIDLDITGPTAVSARFGVFGDIIANDPQITSVTLQTTPGSFGYGEGDLYGVDTGAGGYGYSFGYGYGYADTVALGVITYDVVLNTSTMATGSYQAKFSLVTGESEHPTFNSDPVAFSIAAPPPPPPPPSGGGGGGGGGAPAPTPTATPTPTPTATPTVTPTPTATPAPLPPPIESAVAFANPGDTVTTDTEGDGATPQDPVEASVTTPQGGIVLITERLATGTAPSGFVFLGIEVRVTAPPATPSDPLRIMFTIDASLVAGQSLNAIQVFKNSVLVPDCVFFATGASPDPCVASRTAGPGGDVDIQVRSSTASTWNIGVAAVTPTPTATSVPPAPTPTATATPTVAPVVTPMATPIPTTPAATPTPTPVVTPTVTPSPRPTPTPTPASPPISEVQTVTIDTEIKATEEQLDALEDAVAAALGIQVVIATEETTEIESVHPVPSPEGIGWMPAAVFSHAAHGSTSDCQYCHSGVLEAEADSPLLLPQIETCRECHAGATPSRGRVTSACILCHTFHQPRYGLLRTQ